MSASMDAIGFLNVEGIQADEIGLRQLYSPSRLYSVLLPNNIDSGLCVKELLLLDNSTKTVKKYTVKNSEVNGTDFKANHLYWLADFLLVAMIQRDHEIIQTIYTVDHVANIIAQDRERKYEVDPDALNKIFPTSFAHHISTISIDGKDYLAWPGNCDGDDGLLCIFLIPKNPLFNVSIRQFVLKLTRIMSEIRNFLRLKSRDCIHIASPSFSNGSRLLCKIGVANGTDGAPLELFGAYVTYDVSKLVDIYGKNDYDLLELEYIQETAISLTFLSKPSTITQEDFYHLTDCVGDHGENLYLMVKGSPDKKSADLCLINFDTMECQDLPASLSIPMVSLFSGIRRLRKLNTRK